MIAGLEHLKTDYDYAEHLQNILISQATGGSGLEHHYAKLRDHFLSNPLLESMIPRFLRTNRDLNQFWQYIKFEFKSYQERRDFIWKEFNPLLSFLESKTTSPSEKSITEILERFNSESIQYSWKKALERKATDPEGAITISRTILESVCKHILDAKKIEYPSSNLDLQDLYKLVAKELNLAPEQHHEQIFKQILGGCSSIINGLGAVRNKFGDAHGKGVVSAKPLPRHAELAVNLAGSMALFLIQTFENSSKT